MCMECRQTPCHPRCPNATHTPVCECEQCGYDIYEGDTMYVINGKNICESCIDECKTYAEFEYYDE